MEPNRAPSWNRTPNFRRTRYSSLRARVGRFFSPTQISPLSSLRSPIRHFRKTLLPVPEGPSIRVIRPLGMSQVMSSRTVWEPKDFVSPRTEISVSLFPFGERFSSEVVASAEFAVFTSVLATLPPSAGSPVLDGANLSLGSLCRIAAAPRLLPAGVDGPGSHTPGLTSQTLLDSPPPH